MLMHYFRYLSLLIIITISLSSALARAEDFKDFAELDLEELLNTTVISASKREQKLSEAPNAIYVITAEDIKYSGAVDLPDLFRMVPGVDVVNVYGNSYGVSARGFNKRFAESMLVIIDGRTTYSTFFNGVFWENEQVFLEDIERIEVIRGPGATLWGANAVNGVINIITKDLEEDQELMITGKAGSKSFREAVTKYSANLTDKLSISVTGGYREDQGTRGVNDWRRVPKATGRLKYMLSDNSVLHFFAGFNESEVGLDVTSFTSQTDAHVRNNYQMLKWEHQISDTSQFHLRVNRDWAEVHSDDKELKVEGGIVEVEAQHNFALGKIHQIVWGANYKNSEAKSNVLRSGTDHDDLFGFFIQDEIKLFDTVQFIAGIKYEENSFTGGDWSPRGSLLYSPWSDHHFRFSVSRAYTTMGFFQDNARLIRTLPPPLPSLPIARIIGNEHLDPVKMTAFELGYRTTLFKRIGLNVELYYNDLDDVIDIVTLKQTIPLLISYDNAFNAIAKGVEVSIDLPVTPWWTLTSNYTFQEVENKRGNKDIQGTPKHKFNLGSRFTFQNGFSLDTRLHYVDDTKWQGLLKEVKLDDYLRLDIRIAQKFFNDRLELSVTGQNLTDKLHPEFSDGTETYEVERLIYGQVTLNF
jgi:iron complex outermembrane receptor protein